MHPPSSENDSDFDHLVKKESSERVSYLENSESIEAIHAKAARRGQSEAPSAEDEIEHHYICFVKVSDQLYELDGDRDGPIHRGTLSKDQDVLGDKGLALIKGYTNSVEDGTFGLLAVVERHDEDE